MTQKRFIRDCAGRMAIAAVLIGGFNSAIILAQPIQASDIVAPTIKPRTNQVADQYRKSAQHSQWSQAMKRIPLPPAGCAIANYPAVAWHPVACKTAPNIPLIPRIGIGKPFVVGNGPNDVVPFTNPATTRAEGSFQGSTAGITETGLLPSGASHANVYSLQINSNTFQPSSGCTAGSGPDCQGWQQFVYLNDDNSHFAFIQYWLLAFNAACPSGWLSFPYPGPGDISCFRNSAAADLGADQPVSNLDAMTLRGEVDASDDRVIMTAGGTMVGTVGLNAVGLAAGWTGSEFNIFGAGGGSDASFGPNTTLTVRTLVHNGQNGAPTCSLVSYTGETNNLTVIGMGATGPLPSPGVQFTESNIPGAAAACVGASGIGDTHLYTFAGLLYDFQATGDFTLAESGNFEVQTRQISGAPVWPDASVNQSIAARLGQYDVAICSAQRPEVMVDNKPVSLDDGQILELGDGSGIRRVGNVITMVDPEGNSVRAALVDSHINARVGLGRWPTQVRGLLASSGRDNSVLRGRDGTSYSAPYPFAAFYGNYGESWRVPASRSLLRACGSARENGQPKRSLTVRELEPGLAREARAVCVAAGVGDPALLDACALDVAVLNDKKAAQVFTTLPPPTAVGPIN